MSPSGIAEKSQLRYCVVTATLVEPRSAPPASRNCTVSRLAAGWNGIVCPAVAKIEKVGVPFWLIVVVTLAAGGAKHRPVLGSLWQIPMVVGMTPDPIAAAVMAAPTPTLIVATEKAPDPLAPGMCKMPSLVVVAESAITSGVGVEEKERSTVSTPGKSGAKLWS